MAFFTKMTFARVVIVAGGLLILGMAWVDYKMRQRLDEVEVEVARAPSVVQEIQQLGLEVDRLQKAKSAEGLTALGDPEVYIRSMSQKDKVNIGDVDINVSNKAQSAGIEDKIYAIKPKDKRRAYNRTQIANFMYSLEENSRRVVVTNIDIDPAGKKSIKPHEIGSDDWTFELELTSRQRRE
jgi:hypothetical protein